MTKLEEAYKEVAKAEKKALEETLSTLKEIRKNLDKPLEKVLDTFPAVPGPISTSHTLVREFAGAVNGWPSQLDSMIARVEAHLAHYNDPNPAGTGTGGVDPLP